MWSEKSFDLRYSRIMTSRIIINEQIAPKQENDMFRGPWSANLEQWWPRAWMSPSMVTYYSKKKVQPINCLIISLYGFEKFSDRRRVASKIRKNCDEKMWKLKMVKFAMAKMWKWSPRCTAGCNTALTRLYKTGRRKKLSKLQI